MTTEPRASLVERLRRRATCTDSGGMGFFSQYDSHLLRESADEIARLEALRTQGDGEGDVQFEVWDGDFMVAASSDEADGRHYHAVYSQDGPMALIRAETHRTTMIAAPTQASSREEG